MTSPRLQAEEPTTNPTRDLRLVTEALDWVFRSGYVDGQAAGEALARLLGISMHVEDGGMYHDRLRFEGEPPKDHAPNLLAALRAVVNEVNEYGFIRSQDNDPDGAESPAIAAAVLAIAAAEGK